MITLVDVAEEYLNKHATPNGDMAYYRNKKTPLHIYIAHSVELTSSGIVKKPMDERIVKRINSYIPEWVGQINDICSYLSDSKFSLNLVSVGEQPLHFIRGTKNPLEYFEIKSDSIPHDEGFKLFITDSYLKGGQYYGKGIAIITYLNFVIESRRKVRHVQYNPMRVPLHEFMHGLIGFGHCKESDCLMNYKDQWGKIYLCPKDSEILGWPHKRLKDLRLEGRV